MQYINYSVYYIKLFIIFLGQSRGCGGTIRLNQSNNNISLNNSNISAKTDLNCKWLILVQPSYAVQMQVVNYTEKPKCSSNETNCVCSSLQVTTILILELKM